MTGYELVPESVLERNAEKLSKLQEYVKANMIERPYHNYEGHVKDAVSSFKTYAEKEGLSPRQTFAGISLMTVHDLIFVPYAKDNEEKTMEEAKRVLPICGYDIEEIDEIVPAIYPTKVGIEPRNLLEQIAKDADTDNLGREDFLEKNESVRKEMGIASSLKWYQGSLDFLLQHKYYTKSAREMRNEGKQRNILMLNEMITAGLDIAPAKSVELMGEAS